MTNPAQPSSGAAASFIDSFEQYASTYNAPKRYVRWAAAWLIGTAAKRSIGMKSRGQLLCPNMYIMMIGGPSVGKSQTTKAIESILKPATRMRIIPNSVTRAGLEDYLKENLQQRKDCSGKTMLSSECIGIADEMQGILPDQDLGHLTLYNRMYDLPSLHKAVTRTYGEIRLESPYCSMLTGAQPQFLAQVLPEGAWGMGFMSRTIMIFDVARERQSMFTTSDVDFSLQAQLVAQLREIFECYGWMTWEAEAQALYNEWWIKAGGVPIPQHKRLTMGYNGRRELHMAKLAMICSLAESIDLIVTERHVAAAIEMLIEAESHMTHIFDEMANAGAMVALEDVIELIRRNHLIDKPTEEAVLIELLMQRFPSTQVHSIMENLIASQAIKVTGGINAKGFRKFGPGDKIGKI